MSEIVSPLNVLGSRDSTETFHQQRKKAQRHGAKLRKQLKIHTGDTKNYKTKQKVARISAEDVQKNRNYANVLFWAAERNFIHASEIRLEHAYTRKSRANITSKMKVAYKTLEQLTELTGAAGLPQIDLLTYTAVVHGALLLNRKMHSTAVHSLSVARVALQYLMSRASRENAEEFLYKSIIEDHVDPYLKLAAASKQDALDLNTVARAHFRDNVTPLVQQTIELIEAEDPAFVASLSARAAGTVTEIRWRKYVAELYSPEISRLIQNARAHAQGIVVHDLASYDPALTAWTEVLESHMAQRDQFEENDQTFEILKAYFTFQVLSTRVYRDHAISVELKLRLLADNSASATVAIHKNIISVYNNIISTVGEVLELAGVYNDDELEGTFQAISAYVKADKAEILARSYFQGQEFPQALLLAQEGVLLLTPHAFPLNLWEPLTNVRLGSELRTTLVELRSTSHVLADLASQGSSENALIADNINKYPGGSAAEILQHISIGPLNGASLVVPVAYKPVLYDMAYNYVAREQTGAPAMSKKSSSAKEDKKRGLFGMFG
ncbi:hypothetical protein BABINDRAFT_163637 [Babjeviella inositovora NRRL Y-12698]|uniref:Signal recognition particle subunit SRP68 n=1 Tax=Babjeviella inositovora NRRL Y-12698 TaxID=984486 RepID=A0A1E3QJY5_9ASCO|nr:uncharacterized protein BABINDRAFT_163637 [Babjeviella inositovora NRRL Y-12698]ODQ77392.1 hypothetical protein BABINDRAFT_163637 [Babjeviella inositovora NRRL Y-12698]